MAVGKRRYTHHHPTLKGLRLASRLLRALIQFQFNLFSLSDQKRVLPDITATHSMHGRLHFLIVSLLQLLLWIPFEKQHVSILDCWVRVC